MPRLGNKSGKWNPSMEEEHNAAYFAQYPNISKSPYAQKHQSIEKSQYIRWISPGGKHRILDGTRSQLKNIYVKNKYFDATEFEERFLISKTCIPKIYYRKMSQAEFNAADGKANPFEATFNFINTDNYRYWISSSLIKVQKFGNENAVDNGNIIVKITFNVDVRRPAGFLMKAHHEPGVQTNPAAISIHREGFAQIGTIENDQQVAEILAKNLDHNLGFTSRHNMYLKNALVSYEKL